MSEFLNCVTYQDGHPSVESKEASFTNFDDAYSFAKSKAIETEQMVLFWAFDKDEDPTVRYINVQEGKIIEHEAILPTPTEH